jgi:hypothetical protein
MVLARQQYDHRCATAAPPKPVSSVPTPPFLLGIPRPTTPTLQSLANNEFQSSRYSAPAPGSTTGESQGQFLMNQYALLYSRVAQWGGIAIILGLWVLLGWIAAPLALNAFRFDVFPGTVRRPAMVGPPPGSILAASGLTADAAQAQQPLQVPQTTEAAAAGGAAMRHGEPAAGVAGAAIDGGGAAQLAAGTADGTNRVTATRPGAGTQPERIGAAPVGTLGGGIGSVGLPTITGIGPGATLPAHDAGAAQGQPGAPSGLAGAAGAVQPRGTAHGSQAGSEAAAGALGDDAVAGDRRVGGGFSVSGGQLHTNITDVGAGSSAAPSAGASPSQTLERRAAAGGAAGASSGGAPGVPAVDITAPAAASLQPAAGAVGPGPTTATAAPGTRGAATSQQQSAPAAASGQVQLPSPGPDGRTTPVIDFPKVALAFKDVHYSVRTRSGEDKVLLQNIHGYGALRSGRSRAPCRRNPCCLPALYTCQTPAGHVGGRP